MIEFGQESTRMIRELRTDMQVRTKDFVAKIKEKAPVPAETRNRGLKRKHYYEGRQEADFKAFLRKLYPRGMEKGEVHPVSLNYVKIFAVALADVYRGQVTRRAPGHQEALDRNVKEAKLKRWMPEVERMARVSRTMFIRCVPGLLSKRLTIKPFWAHEVWIVPHPAEPHDPQYALGLMAQVSDTEYEIWTRDVTDGGWFADVIDEATGERRPLLAKGSKWPSKTLPWAVFHDGVTADAYLNTDCDLIDAANDMNAYWTEQMHLVRYQAHTAIAVMTNGDGDVNGGAAGLTRLNQGDQIQAINTNPQILPSLETIKQFTRAQAVIRRQPSQAFSADQTHATSGIARKIETAMADEARDERVADAEDFEVDQLMPILCEMDRIFHPERPNVPEGTEFEFATPPREQFEDPSVTLANLLQLLDRDLVSPVEVLVSSGHAADEKDAHAKIEEARQGAGSHAQDGPEPGPGDRGGGVPESDQGPSEPGPGDERDNA